MTKHSNNYHDSLTNVSPVYFRREKLAFECSFVDFQEVILFERKAQICIQYFHNLTKNPSLCSPLLSSSQTAKWSMKFGRNILLSKQQRFFS